MRGTIEDQEAEREAEKEVSRIGATPGSESGTGAAEEQSSEGLGKLCLSALGPLLPKVSLARRRQEKDLSLQLQHKCPR